MFPKLEKINLFRKKNCYHKTMHQTISKIRKPTPSRHCCKHQFNFIQKGNCNAATAIY